MKPLDQEPESREEAVKRILAQRNPLLLEKSIETYKEQLESLLRDGKYLHMIAYRGSEVVGLAWTHRQLGEILAKKGLTNPGELFIMVISPLEMDDNT